MLHHRAIFREEKPTPTSLHILPGLRLLALNLLAERDFHPPHPEAGFLLLVSR